MKKILSSRDAVTTSLLAIQLILLLSGCCCPCAKKALQHNDQPKEQTEEKPASGN